ncbi:3-oxo-5-alpha-steroid 4-dehydrogenase-domain-containing protein [Fennellomyces sp. T-0311]|nr:3-oxo-5-alpha-steroid 4-dehydrogenase-domain-containing protein [Fennellomyces sp. T-0311]
MLAELIPKAIATWRDPNTYNALLTAYALMPPIYTPILFWIDAPYGRFAGNLFFDWSFPGKWTWCIVEAVSPVMFTLSMLLVAPSPWEPSQVLLFRLWMAHYINRAVLHPYRAPSMAPLHAITSIAMLGFNILNGYTNGVWCARHSFPMNTLNVPVGLGLWVLGFAINVYHDNILFNLRRAKNPKQRYFIPHGGLFKFVSCPNYFGEAIEWAGFAVITWGSYPALTFLAATIGNLFPRATRAHAWYQNEFKEEYPSSRKAVIPFIF